MDDVIVHIRTKRDRLLSPGSLCPCFLLRLNIFVILHEFSLSLSLSLSLHYIAYSFIDIYWYCKFFYQQLFYFVIILQDLWLSIAVHWLHPKKHHLKKHCAVIYFMASIWPDHSVLDQNGYPIGPKWISYWTKMAILFYDYCIQLSTFVRISECYHCVDRKGSY